MQHPQHSLHEVTVKPALVLKFKRETQNRRGDIKPVVHHQQHKQQKP